VGACVHAVGVCACVHVCVLICAHSYCIVLAAVVIAIVVGKQDAKSSSVAVWTLSHE